MNCLTCAEDSCPHIGEQREACEDWTSYTPDDQPKDSWKSKVDDDIKEIYSRLDWMEHDMERVMDVLRAVVKAAQ